MTRLVVAALLLIGAWAVPTPLMGDVSPFLNCSTEPGCDGSDPTLLFADDFEDGVWYQDRCNQNPGAAVNDGWGGNIFFTVNPPPTVVCGGVGAAGTNCAATHGNLASPTPNNHINADHLLSAPANEIYARMYVWYGSGYSSGSGTKMFEVNQFTSNCNSAIHVVNWVIQSNVLRANRSNPTTFCTPTSAACLQNQGNDLTFTGGASGTWYYVEMHTKMSNPAGAANGRFRMWANNCGTTGVCTGSPILRMDHTIVVDSGCESGPCIADTNIRHFILSSWAQGDGAVGERRSDQVRISTVGPIGFAGTTSPTAPAAPTNLRLCPGEGLPCP